MDSSGSGSGAPSSSPRRLARRSSSFCVRPSYSCSTRSASASASAFAWLSRTWLLIVSMFAMDDSISSVLSRTSSAVLCARTFAFSSASSASFVRLANSARASVSCCSRSATRILVALTAVRANSAFFAVSSASCLAFSFSPLRARIACCSWISLAALTGAAGASSWCGSFSACARFALASRPTSWRSWKVARIEPSIFASSASMPSVCRSAVALSASEPFMKRGMLSAN